MKRPVNPFRQGGIAWEVMEMALQGEFDGLPGTEDLTSIDIAELLRTDRQSIINAIGTIKKKTGYIVPYTKLKHGPKPKNNGG